ncbi:MAG: GMC family oxidoreductase [Proteobacteria bacterium]|nr:GMC family oxidoreductase [Pseudomonadota bacterium]
MSNRLRKREKRTLVALTEVAAPPGERLNIPVDPDDIAHKAWLFLDAVPPHYRLAIRSLLALFEGMAILRYGRSFSSLPAEKQLQWVRRWVESDSAPFRLGTRLLLTIVKPAHISRRAAQQQIGHPAHRHDNVVPREVEPIPPERLFIGLKADNTIHCQVAVVGSGAGGAIAAAELAEQGVDVAIIEEGLPFKRPDPHYDPATNLRETYRDGGATIAIGRPALPIPLGVTVGGSTTINSATCFRVPRRIVDQWRARGLHLDHAELNRCFDRVEERIGVQEIPPELLGGSSNIIARGAEALGLSHGPLKRNIRDCRMSAVCAFGCPTAAKQSMDVTYVPRALQNGATLYGGLRAQRVLVKGGRATGLIARPPEGGPTLTVKAEAVISACGSISSVPFLTDSGIRSRHLGRHLTVHPATKIVALMHEIVDGWRDTPQGYCIDEFQDQGLMFEGGYVPPSYASIALPFVGRAFTEVMEEYRRLAMFGVMVSDKGNGRVLPGPGGHPVIVYWMSREDLEKMRAGLQILARVFFAAGAQRIFLPIAGQEEQPSLDSALKALENPLDPFALEAIAFHPLGTTRLSDSPKTGVVDLDLKTWQIDGLYVMDGGVLPGALGVNPQLTIMAFATMAAQRLARQF